MREQYDTSGPGAFEGEPPFARFLYEEVSLNGGGDEISSDGTGYWVERFGRRLLQGDPEGFVYYARCNTVEEAVAEFERMDAALNPDPEEVDA